MKPIRKNWITLRNGKVFGIIVGEDERTKERKAYFHEVSGLDEEADTKKVLQMGSPITVTLLEDIMDALQSRPKQLYYVFDSDNGYHIIPAQRYEIPEDYPIPDGWDYDRSIWLDEQAISMLKATSPNHFHVHKVKEVKI